MSDILFAIRLHCIQIKSENVQVNDTATVNKRILNSWQMPDRQRENNTLFNDDNADSMKDRRIHPCRQRLGTK
jgi:hypothetical protein